MRTLFAFLLLSLSVVFGQPSAAQDKEGAAKAKRIAEIQKEIQELQDKISQLKAEMTKLQPAAKPVQENQADYYPLRLGNKWHYQADVNGRTVKVFNQVGLIQKSDGPPLARIDVVLDGKTQPTTDHMAASATGVFRHRISGPGYDDRFEPALCLLKYPVKEGETWQTKTKIGTQEIIFKCTVGKWEEVVVPAGKYKAIPVRLTSELNGTPVIADYWFAANVGIVMQRDAVNNITLKLEKFEEGKRGER